uniref:ArsR/SmtB family transcription factor n=1 Tax=Pararhizobium sp. IMCC3301 TaxID=3067904 RepID=UPI0027425C7C|nr:metalloregulator ArsR/SmtB family transcription factor [Pararhizobium sp. IMCC3301]
MREQKTIGLEQLVEALRGAGETTRLRLLALLQSGDLTVKDLTQILGQSQPRVSRHLKLLVEAALIERFPEGSWVYYRPSKSPVGLTAQALLNTLNPSDSILQRDQERLAEVKSRNAETAARYFAQSAQHWDRIRSHHISERAVEKALLELVGDKPFGTLLDVGTGTGRMLELLQGHYADAVGIDSSLEMLALARANLDASKTTHAQVRFGDIFNLPVARNTFDVAVVHQVLHFLDDPARAIKETAQALRPGGRLLIVDFAPHQLEFLRNEHAHRRLGFDEAQMASWIDDAGLDLLSTTHLTPEKPRPDALTVNIWLAQDPRILIAADTMQTRSTVTSETV